uniref:Uncharacterized protein n=1 Tax=Rhizophora mucronata TaxID=61149 RepID=A0A2P2QQM2_RHIMU
MQNGNLNAYHIVNKVQIDDRHKIPKTMLLCRQNLITLKLSYS